MSTKENFIQYLQQVIRSHDYHYHVADAPIISDDVYDSLYRQLVSLEMEFPHLAVNSPTQKASQTLKSEFKQVQHVIPMQSLDNAYSIDEVYSKINTSDDLDATQVSAELKIDGLALSLTYVNGHLAIAATRGDHFIGENVTENVMHMDAIPKTLQGRDIPDLLEVRGEVFMTYENLKKYNEWALSAGKQVLRNVRNAAAGCVRNTDPENIKQANLSFYVYRVVTCSTTLASSHFSQLQSIKSWGLPVSDWNKLLVGLKNIQKYRDVVFELRNKLPFAIDGVVIKVDDISQHLSTTSSGKYPKWAVAYKFPPENQKSILEGVKFQVGRTGIIAPVALLTPTEVGGVVVSRASLCNRQYIERKDLRIGDHVNIYRGGDVIPQVDGVDHTVQPRTGVIPIAYPTHCPSCNTELDVAQNGILTYCRNGFNCKDQLIQFLVHFSSKTQMNITGLSEATLEDLINRGLVKTPADIYRLKNKTEEMLKPGYGHQRIKNLLESIESSKKTTLQKFIVSLGIPEVGESTANALAKKFGTIEKLIAATDDDLRQIKDVGPVTCLEIKSFLSSHLSIITELLDEGILVSPLNIVQDEFWAGRTVVITGTFESWSRDELKNMLTGKGAKVSSSVSSKTDFVLVGTNAGSKESDAIRLNIKQLNEDDIKRIV